MTDSIVELTAGSGTKIDNALVEQADGQLVNRQRVQDPELIAVIHDLNEALGRFGTAFDGAGRMRVNTDQIGGATTLPVTITSGTVTTVTTVTTATTVGTVTALANLAPAGIVNPSAQLLNAGAAALRNHIVVS